MAELSFEGAIAQAEKLLADPSLSPAELQQRITELLQTSNGARGFFVTFLTGEWQISPEVISAVQAVPQPSAELMVKNLVMSTAMAITHQRQGDAQQAEGSRRVAQRSSHLLQAWLDRDSTCPVKEIARAMYTSATTNQGEYTDFLRKWGYDPEQLQAIATVLAPFTT